MADELTPNDPRAPENDPAVPQPLPGTVFRKYDNEPVPNHFDKFDKEADAGQPGLWERARLNDVHAYYTGTAKGAGELNNLSRFVTGEATGLERRRERVARLAPEITERLDKEYVQAQKERYYKVTSDLNRYEAMQPWGNTLEAVASMGGALVGSLQSPESYLGWPARSTIASVRGIQAVTGVTAESAAAISRTLSAATQQALIGGAVDVPVQHLNIASRVQHEYDWTQTAGAVIINGVIGGGAHLFTGELLSKPTVNATFREHSVVDPSLRKSGDPAPSAAEIAASSEIDRNQIYIITDPRGRQQDGEQMPVVVLRDPVAGNVTGLMTPSGGIVEVPPAYRNLPIEQQIAYTFGDHPQGAVPDFTKVRRVAAEEPAAPPVAPAPEAPAPAPPAEPPPRLAPGAGEPPAKAGEILIAFDQEFEAGKPVGPQRWFYYRHGVAWQSGYFPTQEAAHAAALQAPPPRAVPAPAPPPKVFAPEEVLPPEQTTPNVHRVTTPDGQTVDVRPVVMEARDLVTSFDANYDKALQPRDRSKIASQQQRAETAANLDPNRLGFSTEAGFGAPIIDASTKEVLSGNLRAEAIRTAYAQHPERAQAYRDWIAQTLGLDVSGFEHPVVVREIVTPLTPEQRMQFTVGANQAPIMGYSAGERALVDARMVTIDDLALINVPDNLAAPGNRDFVRAFIGKLPVNEQGPMLTATGQPTSEAITRIRNAIVAKAYGDAPVLTRISESIDDEVKGISNALVAAAPEWAKLRADVDAGLVRADMEQTAALMEAVSRTADLREKGMKLDTLLAQEDPFAKENWPIVRDFMRLFYDPAGRRAASSARITDGLNFYTEEARKVTAQQLDLGLAPVTPQEVQRVARERAFGQVAREVAQEGLPTGRGVGYGEGAAAARPEVRGPGAGAPGLPTGAAGVSGGEGRAGRPAGPVGAAAEAGAPGIAPLEMVRRGEAPEVQAMRTSQRIRQEQQQPSLFEQRVAEGQQALPGVGEPTVKERLEREAQRPLTGGAAGPAPGGLFDVEGRAAAEAQGTLFMRPPPAVQPLARRRSGEVLAGERQRPLGGIPEAQRSTAQTEALQSLQQQTTALADVLEVPLHQGRVVRGALGHFNSRTGVARIKEIADFEVATHELGHAIEVKIGTPLSNLIQQFDHELAQLVSDPSAYPPNQWAKEGFAEYTRRNMGSPGFGASSAPGFDAAYKQLLQQQAPDIAKALDDAGRAYRAYQDAPSVDVVASVRRSQAETPRGWAKITQTIRDEGFFPSIKLFLEHVYTNFSDQRAPFTRAVHEMALLIRERTGKLADLKSADNPDILLRQAARSEQASILDMQLGVQPYHRPDLGPQGPSLAAAVAKATGQPSFFGRWDAESVGSFDVYLMARMAEYDWRRYRAGQLPNPPVAFSHGDALIAMAELERANPTFRQAGDMAHGYSRELLKKMRDGHLITPELHDKLAAFEFYVPMMRDMSDRPLAGAGMGGAGYREGISNIIQRKKGSSRDIISPVESLMLQTNLLNRKIMHNDVILALKDLAAEAGPEGGRFFEPISAKEAAGYKFDIREPLIKVARERGIPEDDIDVLNGLMTGMFGEDPVVAQFWRMEQAGARGEPIVFYKEGGIDKAARVMSGAEDHPLYELLTTLPVGLRDMGLQIMSTASGVLRSGITTNPVYILSNYIRDQIAVGILRPDYIPFVSSIRGLISEVSGGEAARLYGYAGGVAAGAHIAPVQQAAATEIDALAKQGYVVNRVSSLHGLLQLASFTEAGTRNSIFDIVYKNSLKRGLSPQEAMVEAAYQATTSALDFGQMGSRTQALVALTPFVNAWQVGMDTMWKRSIEPIYRRMAGGEATLQEAAMFKNALLAWTKMAGLGSVLGFAWAALHSKSEVYQDAAPSMRGTHFITELGGKVIVIPKPFELSLGFTVGEYAYMGMSQGDPRAATQLGKAAWEVLKPPLPYADNPLLKTGYELWANKSTFTGRPLIPEEKLGLPVEQQTTDRTSAWGKSIGNAIGVSPIKVDHAIGALFGTWGRDMVALGGSVDPDSPTSTWEDRVFLRRFIKDPNRSSDVTTKFWDYMRKSTGEYNQALNGYNALVQGFQDAEAQQFLRNLPANQRTYVTLHAAGQEDRTKPAFNADVRRLHPLQRAYEAVTMLNAVRTEMTNNTFRLFNEPGEQIKLSPQLRRDVLDNVRELAQMELRNALVIMKEPGYGGRPLLNTQIAMDKIRAVSPQIAQELADRYSTAKIYTTDSVSSAWPQLKREVLRDGSEADVKDLALDAKAEGYEFEDQREAGRVKKPAKRQIVIPGLTP